MAPGELRRFVERFGARALLDEHSRAFAQAGLGYMRLDNAEILERLVADQRLLRLPLIRSDQRLSVGHAESAWRGWIEESGTSQ